ncbi:UDP-N-acetylmuramoyl-L-alanyl-D-glutamate--2,6-diaminopimelate ligase [Paenibacillus sp. L3-i20]|uniref:UDP-N-acetylmuramoyl-L-alanyl-D-glutamate--2, 6-diaminopimelate ligase n=1 Tax=Paenibacillus sp. L3-i20 TaxID=2905833 RepID=UPI001EE0D644|nr:UDP-N-acetylmuramoyl-L-alanyl-D-glutamate--2,6-diaminopimelate ligase [Paenibacillus sp. L3-i20]GKU76998.1 UDP-N-acetylmuramoyl-L-alanyl-D-glutamate--2,6-diaminopimelate ligase [Paenibacillus sp. L3-i20]
MLLASLVEHLEYTTLQGDSNTNISSIAFDSREVVPNALFVAISGFTVDGHTFIERAIELGATAILVERDIVIDAPVTVLKVADTRYAMAHASARFYNNPTEKLNLIGITGTNGKTSTTYFIKSILEQSKRTVGVIGTIGAMVGNQSLKTKSTTPTTPESLHLQHMFADMVDTGVHDCVMEVSSHALSLQRTAASRFKSGIFTNLTPDHLELHNTMEEYFEAKAMLFDLTTDYNIVNMDDEYGRRLATKIASNPAKLVTYGIENDATIRAADIRQFADYTSYVVHTPTGSVAIQTNLPGIIYVYNSLAAIACAYCNGINLDQISAGIRAVKSIKGRLEVVYQDEERKIIVDFAHTEDSLEKALSTLRPFTKGRLILVFGVYAAPGKLGSGKRQAMGTIAGQYSDIAIVTSDNPKDQDPDAIIAEVSAAVQAAGGMHRGIVDRREAIQYAIDISERDDVILIAGKGHETSQVIGKTEIPFNEAEIVNDIMSGK